ncbi:protein YgfX [Pseudoalteromonas peptidolytica]|nr:protein YgfX [Pseudoalteromonas peptidolytica]MDW7547931.1 protein YgfX [Pseudoalteromonas peptidolytica]
MVLALCLTFLFLLLFPLLWWFITPVCFVLSYWCWRQYQALTPTCGTLLLLPEKNYIEVQSLTMNVAGRLMAATIWFDIQIELKLQDAHHLKQRVFIRRDAVRESDWRLLCRLMLNAR